MQEKHYAFLAIFLVCATLAAGFFFIKYDLLDQGGGDAEEEEEIIEEVVKPEDVDLRINCPEKLFTHHNYPMSIEGAPNGSISTWYRDEYEIAQGETIEMKFVRSDYFEIRIHVKWGVYEKNVSKKVAVKFNDDIWGFGGDGNITIYGEDEFWFGRYYEIGITTPTLWYNISITGGIGIFNYSLNLVNVITAEIFEVVINESVNISEGNYSRSFYFDQNFFKAREINCPFYMNYQLKLTGGEEAHIYLGLWNEMRY